MSSIINSSSSPAVAAAFFGSTTVQAAAQTGVNLGATFEGSTEMSAQMTGGYALQSFQGSTSFSAALSIVNDFSARFEGRTDFVTQLLIERFDSYSLAMVLDILPSTVLPNVNWMPRLKVDGVEVSVVEGTYSERQDSSGGELSVVLANRSQVGLLVPGASIDFGFGRKMAGLWVEEAFVHKIVDGELIGLSRSIGASGIGWTDSFTVRAKSKLQRQFDKAPARDTVIYDSSELNLQASDFEPLYDSEGNLYSTELVPISGLMVHDLFEEIFINRLNFSGYVTNLPNWRLSRVDCNVGQSYVSAIRGFFGMFDPVLFEKDDKIWIVDTTLALPTGFPAPEELTVNKYSTLSANRVIRDLDGMMVQYVEEGRTFDYVTTREETEEEVFGDSTAGSEVEVRTTLGYREYRKFAQPSVVQKEELYKEWKDTYDQSSTLISRVRENKLFNNKGQLYFREKTVQDLVPDVENGGAMTLTLTREEKEYWTYKTHPYLRRKQYLARHELQTRGLIVVDSESQMLGRDFKQEYHVSNVTGNLTEGQSVEYGPLRTQITKYRPRRDGQMDVQEFEAYHPSSVLLKNGARQIVPGDGAVSAFGPQPRRVLVLADGVTALQGGEVASMHGGELPVTYLVPLAQRRLRAMKSKGREINATVVGHNVALSKGTPVAIAGRTPSGGTREEIGSFLILGLDISFSGNGVTTDLALRELDEAGVYVFSSENPVGSYSFQMVESTQVEFSAEVACRSGYALSCSTVSDVAVEARLSGDVGWTAIETTPIDLTPYDGTTVEFEFRVTAGAASAVLKRSFVITVEHA